jgi:hypothetical protein
MCFVTKPRKFKPLKIEAFTVYAVNIVLSRLSIEIERIHSSLNYVSKLANSIATGWLADTISRLYCLVRAVQATEWGFPRVDQSGETST